MSAAPETIAFLGVGVMGEALLKGSLRGGLDTNDVWVTAKNREHVDDLVATYGVHGTTNNVEAASRARMVILAVRPQQLPNLVDEVAEHLRDDAVVVSLADGVSLADLAGRVPDEVAVARAMPSLTAQISHGFTLLTTGGSCTEEQAAAVTTLFARSGDVLDVEEDQHAVLGPLSSGGPAYFLYVADAMIEAGAVRGIPRGLARRLVVQAMTGSSAWLQDSVEDAAALRGKVCAPGGAGIQRIAELDERAVRAAFVKALTLTTPAAS